MPKSCYLFVAAGVVFLLQAVPVPGVFLMILAGPLWPGVLINAGFAGIALEVLAGGVSPGWLALPGLWFGGYALRAGCDWWALARLRAELAEANARVRVPFDPAVRALVFTEDEERADSTAAWLAERYDVGVAYTRLHGAPTYQSWRLAPAAVGERVHAPEFRGLNVHTRSVYADHPSGKHWRRTRVADLCLLRMPDAPDRPVVHVWHSEPVTRRGTLPVRLVTTTIITSDGRSYELRSGDAAPLARWPMPILGFALDSGTPAWRRITGWHRRRVALVSGGARAELTRALGLTPVPPDARRAADVDAMEAALARLLRARGIGDAGAG